MYRVNNDIRNNIKPTMEIANYAKHENKAAKRSIAIESPMKLSWNSEWHHSKWQNTVKLNSFCVLSHPLSFTRLQSLAAAA